MINNDVTEEIISLYENEISKTSEYKPNEIMVKLTARILDKYYPKDKTCVLSPILFCFCKN